MADSQEHCGDLCVENVLVKCGENEVVNNRCTATESPYGEGCFECEGRSDSLKEDDKCTAGQAMTSGKWLCSESPPNGCVSIAKNHGLEDNGIVKVTEETITGIRECFGGESTLKEDPASNITTDSEECPTPSTDKTQLSDSESPSEEGQVSVTPGVLPLCDSLASTSISGLPSVSSEHQQTVPSKDMKRGIEYVVYESELQMSHIMRLITKDLSEPYSIYTYRYFIHNWPKLCFLAMESDTGKCVGAIVCKLDVHKKLVRRGYIAMLAVDQHCRRRGIGSHLVLKAIKAMVDDECDEVVLETEITNKAALHLYENLGFVRDKRLFRYYLNGVDALRLKLWLT